MNAWFGDVGIKLNRGLRVVRNTTTIKSSVILYVVSP